MPTRWHEVPLRTVTPAFLGRFGSGDTSSAEVPFPVPSLRGVLAYWLRALAGAHIGNSTGLLHNVESAVFGAARTRDSGGPSPLQLRADRIRVGTFSVSNAPAGLRYLMGPGLTQTERSPSQETVPRYLAPGPIRLRVRNTGTPAHADLFLAALWALRTFGGIGARTRRGFGTLAIGQAPDLPAKRFDLTWLSRDSVEDFAEVLSCVSAAIADLGLAVPPSGEHDVGPMAGYPCFAQDRYRLSADDTDELTPGQASNWSAALSAAGDWLWAFRHGASPRDRTTWPRPQPGYHSQTYTDVAQTFLNGALQTGPLTAGALGLPIPYSDHQGPPSPVNPGKPTQRTAIVQVRIDGELSRRASPLWLRVLHDGRTWRLRSLAFFAEWLPSQPRARLEITRTKAQAGRPKDVDRPTDAQIRAELNRWFD